MGTALAGCTRGREPLKERNRYMCMGCGSEGYFSPSFCWASIILLPPSLPPSQLMEGARSVQRAIVNNFLDGTKQDAIEMLLLGNAYAGDLGQKVKALLDPVDTFGECEASCTTLP